MAKNDGCRGHAEGETWAPKIDTDESMTTRRASRRAHALVTITSCINRQWGGGGHESPQDQAEATTVQSRGFSSCRSPQGW